MANDNPLLPNKNEAGEQPAVDLIRSKLAKIYGDEPNAAKELAEADAASPRQLSKHQQFMLDLQNSGKPLAEIQTGWHDYYLSLPDDEKRQVWQEFYDQQSSVASHPHIPKSSASLASKQVDQASQGSENKAVVSEHTPAPEPKPIARRRHIPKARKLPVKRPAEIRSAIKARAAARREFERKNVRAKHNLQSLAFGLVTGFIVLLIFMFGFFNQKFLAPFIHPGSASATPIILDPSAISPTKLPEVIIPKINVEIPLVGFDLHTTSEAAVETALEDGVVHYPTTVLPGQQGNTAYFGHSSNNIFSPGKYKFAFVLLHELNKGDIFYITYDQKVYVYKVYDKQIVSPSNVGVLNDVPGKLATATLITCDPPGTSLNRLVVWGEQISPSPSKNSIAGEVPIQSSQPSKIAGNGPSLLSRIWPF